MISPNSDYDGPTDNGPLAWNAWLAESRKQPQNQTCPACGDQRFVLTGDATRGGRLIPCPLCSGDDKTRWLERNCGLELRERELTLDDYHTEIAWPAGTTHHDTAEARNRQRADAMRVIVHALEERKGIYTVWGDFGAGKSHALHIIVAECLRAGVEALYATTSGVLDHLRSLYALGKTQQHATEPDRYWRRLLNIPALCLDEVDRFNATDWAMSQFFTLVDTRYRRRESHLTVFATNSDPREENAEIVYLFSRMREFTLVRLQGDVRQVKG